MALGEHVGPALVQKLRPLIGCLCSLRCFVSCRQVQLSIVTMFCLTSLGAVIGPGAPAPACLRGAENGGRAGVLIAVADIGVAGAHVLNVVHRPVGVLGNCM